MILVELAKERVGECRLRSQQVRKFLLTNMQKLDVGRLQKKPSLVFTIHTMQVR